MNDATSPVASRQTPGQLQGLSLSSLLQVLALEGKSMTVTVRSRENVGRMYILDGDLIHAEAGPLSGMDAAYEIVNWEETPVLSLEAECVPRDRTIQLSVTGMLLTGMIKRDEESLGGAGSGPRPELDGIGEEQNYDGVTVMHGIEAVIQRFHDEVPGFIAVDIVEIDSGFSISGISASHDLEIAAAPAAYAEVIKANQYAVGLLGLAMESTEDILVTTDQVYVLLRMVDQAYYLILSISRKSNLGLARAIMRKHHSGLVNALRDIA